MIRVPSISTMRGAALLVGAALCGGCGEEAPPFDALPLRDALRASPEVIASLPEETRRDVALRIEEADGADEDRTAITPSEMQTLDAFVAAADEQRESDGKDALVFGEIKQADDEIVLQARRAPEGSPDATNEKMPAMRGRPGQATAALEEIALKGRAGRRLRELATFTKTHDIVRTTGLPIGAVAWNDTLYVNASWLVALSALEDQKNAVPALVVVPGAASEAPGLKPLSVDYNPYFLPDSIAQCANQVEGTCACAQSQSCLHEVTDSSFADANAECTWVNQSASNASALCVLALMSADGVRACVESAGSACAALPVTTREDALAFVASDSCMDVLDACLSGGSPPSQPSGGSQGCGGCSNGGCDACSDSNDSCSKCNDNCSKCNDNCAQCNQNSKDCNNNCKSCSVASTPMPGRSPVPAPVGTALWIFAPIAYLLRTRRRS